MCTTVLPPAATEISGGPDLFPPQRDLLAQGFVESRENWLICTPTGSGKTRMAEWAVLAAVGRGRSAGYTAPLKAIVEERIADWRKRLPDLRLGLFTGDTVHPGSSGSPTDENLLLFTPEKLAGYVHRWKRHLGWLSRLDILVVDEFHVLGDRSRGAGIEALLGRLRRVNPFLRIVALSATLSNREEVAHWLQARLFCSDWRPIEIEKRIVRFQKAEHKPDLLRAEVHQTLAAGGKALVFVNSRKRSEALASRLQEEGIRADFNHAGLDRERRSATQTQMRRGELDVVVSTSTLEMGVNFPARKVIVYDSYGFDGESFAPISVQRFVQCAGRAGRPGYDDRGEAVLFLPVWAPNGTAYLSGEVEPVRSGLFAGDALARELVSEVASRLSISEDHLETNFAARTLWRAQGGSHHLHFPLRQLLDAGLLKRSGEEGNYLSETALGRVVAQVGVAPETVLAAREVYRSIDRPEEFDLLLTACLAREATPKLGFNFEEIDLLTDLVLRVPSCLLDGTFQAFRSVLGTTQEKAALSAVKCAAILWQHTQGVPLEALAERYDAYPADLAILRENVSWVLDAMQRVFGILRKADTVAKEAEGQEPEPAPSPQELLAEDLRAMIQYGVPRRSIGLVRIKGIGSRRAQALLQGGIPTPEVLVQVGASVISRVLGLSPKTVAPMVKAARALVSGAADPSVSRETEGPVSPREVPNLPWPTDMDPYRLRRALELRVDHVSPECVRVSGGAEPHTVWVAVDRRGRASFACDCQDFAKGHAQCKHVIRARLELRDDQEILAALRALHEAKDRPLRYALGDLWMRIAGPYDAFCGRRVDYTGQAFLDRAAASTRWKR